MKDIEKTYTALQKFAFACIAQANQNKEPQLDDEHKFVTATPSNIDSNGRIPISFPHLALDVLQILRNIVAETDEQLSKQDIDLIEALEVFVKTFPLWTAQQLGDSILTKFVSFIKTNDLEMSVNEKNEIYGNLGDIALAAYLKNFKHKNPLIKKFSKRVEMSTLIHEIEFMLKLIKYDRNDINYISNITVYINDSKPLVLAEGYLNKAKIKKDFEKLDTLTTNIKSLTGWRKIDANIFLSNLLDAIKNIAETINMHKTQLKRIVEILDKYPVSKTASYVFINDTLCPFMDGLKSEKEILSLISANNDVLNASNINRQKKKAVEKLLKRKSKPISIKTHH